LAIKPRSIEILDEFYERFQREDNSVNSKFDFRKVEETVIKILGDLGLTSDQISKKPAGLAGALKIINMIRVRIKIQHEDLEKKYAFPLCTHLLAQGADSCGKTQILLAITKTWELNTIKALLQAGACLDDRDEVGQTPLMLATMRNRVDLVLYLLNNHLQRMNINLADFEEKKTALHYAARWDAESLIEPLVLAKADVKALDYKTETPLHTAARYGHPQIVMKLLKLNCDPNSKNDEGHTALTVALNKRNLSESNYEDYTQTIKILQLHTDCCI
jgi:ankyrin repeat protein